MIKSKKELSSTHFLFHTLGYGLLLFVISDIFDIFVPLQLMNPTWEFQTIGTLIERVPLPLIGLVLVFYGEERYRSKRELAILKLFSHASLVVGLLFLLLIPLCISNSIRINNINNEQINTQINQQLSQIQQVEQRLNKATEQDILTLFTQNKSQKPPEIKNPQELKESMLTAIKKSENRLKTQAEVTRKDKVLGLIKNTVKWCLGAVIAATLFIQIWQATHWVRNSKNLKLGT